MNILFFLLTFIFTLTPFTSSAAEDSHHIWAAMEKTIESTNASQPRIYFLISHKEQDLWFLDFYQKDYGKLQRRIWQKNFSKKDNYNKTLQNTLKKFSLQPVDKNTDSFVENMQQTEYLGTHVWTAKNQWNENWEKKYSRWVEEEVDKDFFFEHGIATDCADVAIGLRWIFARIHSLPAANSLAGTGAILSNESMKKSWLNLRRHENWWQDHLFRTALNYVLNNTYTHSLWKDSYPIAIDKDSFVPGVWYLSKSRSSGHVEIVQSIDRSRGDFRIYIIDSTVPRDVKRLFRQTLWHRTQPHPDRAGFMAMRWPVKKDFERWDLTKKEKMFRFSKEQYQSEFMQGQPYFNLAVLNNIGSVPLSPLAQVTDLGRNIYDTFTYRLLAVEKGYHYCVVQGKDCTKGTWGWNSHSTPSRDWGIRSKINTFFDIHKRYGSRVEVQEKWQEILGWGFKVPTSQRVYQTHFEHLMNSFHQKKASYDPNDSIESRWNL